MPDSASWYPSRLFSPADSHSNQGQNPTPIPYALVILNQPINKPALTRLLPNASLLVCADAGGDKYRAYFQEQSQHPKNLNPNLVDTYPRLPDAIIGDLDSITPDTLAYWRALNVEIRHDTDQYSTDLTKCLVYLRRVWCDDSRTNDSELDVIVLGGLGGRVDQGFSLIHHLILARSDANLLRGRLYLVSEVCLSFVLDQGGNEVWVDGWDLALRGEGDSESESESEGMRVSRVCSFQESVGIIPLTGPAVLTLEGFEWDVRNWKTEFGGQVSTSNHIRNNRLMVDVKGSNICLFTMELAKHLQMGYM